jgi:predicted nuclease of predicted toxin-antitoxin system
MLNDSDKPLKRYIWIPAHTKTNDQRQTLFLNRLKRDEAGINTEIIESPIETFKTILAGRLNDNHFYIKEDYDNIFKIYLITEETLSKEVEKIYSTLTLSGLKAVTLDISEQIGIYARHLQKLRDCDSVIIYQQGDNKFWLNSKLRDIIKAPGIGREKPFKKVVIISGNLPDENLLKLIRTKIELIDTNKFNAELLLQKLISE